MGTILGQATPGPWRVGHNYGAVVTDVNHPGVWTDEDNRRGYGGYLVCESVHSAANACLIATAPELLETLVMVRDADDDCRRDGLQIIPLAARARIDTVIAKAQGREGTPQPTPDGD